MFIELNLLLNERLCCCGLEAKKLSNITWDGYKCIYMCVYIKINMHCCILHITMYISIDIVVRNVCNHGLFSLQIYRHAYYVNL